jgi:hypothetical protein
VWKDKEDHPSPFLVMSAITKREAGRLLQQRQTTTSLNEFYTNSITQRSIFLVRLAARECLLWYLERSRLGAEDAAVV